MSIEFNSLCQLSRARFLIMPGYRLKHSFVHRMANTRSHTPILRVLKAAVDISESVNPTVPKEPEMTEEERLKWMQERRKQMAQLRDRKTFRRGGEKWCEQDSCAIAMDPSTESVLKPESVSPAPVVEEVKITCAGLNDFQPVSEKTLKIRKSNFNARKFQDMIRRKRRESCR